MKVADIAVFGHDGDGWGLLREEPPRVEPHSKYVLRCELCHLDVQMRSERAAVLLDGMAEMEISRVTLRALGSVISSLA